MAKKKKKSKNYYFTSDTEQAIISYSNTDCKQIREELYRQQIQPAFDELVDKIVYTYKFTSLENIDFLKDDCKIWLTTILGKFDASKGTKAFSYFSVVTKNWFTHKAKKQTQKNVENRTHSHQKQTNQAGLTLMLVIFGEGGGGSGAGHRFRGLFCSPCHVFAARHSLRAISSLRI